MLSFNFVVVYLPYSHSTHLILCYVISHISSYVMLCHFTPRIIPNTTHTYTHARTHIHPHTNIHPPSLPPPHTHRPRRGRVETEIKQPREAELLSHKDKTWRHVKAIQSKMTGNAPYIRSCIASFFYTFFIFIFIFILFFIFIFCKKIVFLFFW